MSILATRTHDHLVSAISLHCMVGCLCQSWYNVSFRQTSSSASGESLDKLDDRVNYFPMTAGVILVLSSGLWKPVWEMVLLPFSQVAIKYQTTEKHLHAYDRPSGT